METNPGPSFVRCCWCRYQATWWVQRESCAQYRLRVCIWWTDPGSPCFIIRARFYCWRNPRAFPGAPIRWDCFISASVCNLNRKRKLKNYISLGKWTLPFGCNKRLLFTPNGDNNEITKHSVLLYPLNTTIYQCLVVLCWEFVINVCFFACCSIGLAQFQPAGGR